MPSQCHRCRRQPVQVPQFDLSGDRDLGPLWRYLPPAIRLAMTELMARLLSDPQVRPPREGGAMTDKIRPHHIERQVMLSGQVPLHAGVLFASRLSGSPVDLNLAEDCSLAARSAERRPVGSPGSSTS